MDIKYTQNKKYSASIKCFSRLRGSSNAARQSKVPRRDARWQPSKYLSLRNTSFQLKVAGVMVMLSSALQRPHADSKARDAKVETSVELQQEVANLITSLSTLLALKAYARALFKLRWNPTTTSSLPSFLCPSHRSKSNYLLINHHISCRLVSTI